MKVSNKEVHESITLPGQTFVLRTVTEARRMAFRSATAGAREQLDNLNSEVEKLAAEPEESRNLARLDELQRSIHAIYEQQVNPLYIQHFLISTPDLRGETDSDEEIEVSPETLFSFAPAAFYSEVLIKIKDRLSLGGAQLKNFESLITSTDPEA